MRGEAKRIYEFGPFRLDPAERVLFRNGEIVPLTLKVFELLQALVENCGHIVSKDQLMIKVWPDAVVDEGNINRNISTLRRALGEESAGQQYIETIPKRGYRFIGSVRELHESTDVVLERVTRSSLVIEEETEDQRFAVVPAIEAAPGRAWKRVAIVLTVVLVAAFAAALYWKPFAAPHDPMRLTNNPATDRVGSWSPDGTRIAFTSNRDGKEEIYVMERDGSNETRLTRNSADDWGPSWSSDGSKLAFTSRRDGNAEIYVMNADGSNPQRLTDNTGSDLQPAWSHDSRIVFSSNRKSSNPYNFDIYVMQADGTNPTRLTDDPEFDSDPAWSSDGTTIAFVSGREGQFDVFVMNADGSNQKNLTRGHKNSATPSWSPDGFRIAFTSNRDGNYEIYMMDADGSNEIRLTDNPETDAWPSWSPDGQQIVFHSERDGNSEIYVISPDDLARLTDHVADDVDPVWSPDGSRIVFASKREGNFEIYAMNADGRHQRRLTSSSADDVQPAWSPDGTSIAFTSRRDGNQEIYLMNADGRNQRRLTNDGANDSSAAWSPDSKRVAFSSDRGGGGSDIYVVSANGNGLVRLTKTTGSKPAWSPDGARIAFQSNREVHFQIYMISSSGGQATKLTRDEIGYVGPPWYDSAEPAWSPDGSRIGFRKVVDNIAANMKIFVMNSDGSAPRRLTYNPSLDRNPAWSPDGRKIAFQSNRAGNLDIYVLTIRE